MLYLPCVFLGFISINVSWSAVYTGLKFLHPQISFKFFSKRTRYNEASNENGKERGKIIFIPIKSFKTHKTLLAVIN